MSRGGEKLAAALDAFKLDVSGWACADFGCNVGGFTDCLLRRGAARVYAVDTGYGALDWRLRKDPRVVVMERTNALYAAPPAGGVNLAVVDVAFTPQRLIVPAAGRWLSPGGQVVSLLKPHYELAKSPARKAPGRKLIDETLAEEVRLNVSQELQGLGFAVVGCIRSPLRGKGGNPEFLLHIQPRQAV